MSSFPLQIISKPGSQIINELNNVTGFDRDKYLISEYLSGNFPNFIRNIVPITIITSKDSFTYFVTPDYLCVGNDDDYFSTPMSAPAAQKIANTFGCILPTVKMVDDIWKASKIKISPVTMPPNNLMMSTKTFAEHFKKVQKQLELKGYSTGDLISNRGKDVVLTEDRSRVSIYGWYQNDKPIQGLSTAHDSMYYDYSHFIRLVDKECILNDNKVDIEEILVDPKFSPLITKSITVKSYNTNCF